MELEQTAPVKKKKSFFSSNPYKIDGMLISLGKMLELSNFGHITTSTL